MELNESEPFDEASLVTYAILKTNERLVHWDKCRDYQFIDCIGIWGKGGRNYTWAHLRNRRTYLPVQRENGENLFGKPESIKTVGIGAD